ncbi:short-chain dehydrogenase reductase ATA1-like [Stegodyphus dumicola]|uniref:short-chain dehydrogenase reductase ATA1-like n=1 Tax=Stegodyphus dumicola TaxID=202533 RepID=UPI0015A7881D|nr:short-chain dehydrogenase reductase ATA1-like [Stegodyphus dumicola]
MNPGESTDAPKCIVSVRHGNTQNTEKAENPLERFESFVMMLTLFTFIFFSELASFGVRVNSVNPGVIITEIHKRGGMSEEEYEKFLEHCKETHALGRPGTVDEVAQAIIFLADEDKSSFITGVNLPIDGGRGVMCPR